MTIRAIDPTIMSNKMAVIFFAIRCAATPQNQRGKVDFFRLRDLAPCVRLNHHRYDIRFAQMRRDTKKFIHSQIAQRDADLKRSRKRGGTEAAEKWSYSPASPSSQSLRSSVKWFVFGSILLTQRSQRNSFRVSALLRFRDPSVTGKSAPIGFQSAVQNIGHKPVLLELRPPLIREILVSRSMGAAR